MAQSKREAGVGRRQLSTSVLLYGIARVLLARVLLGYLYYSGGATSYGAARVLLARVLLGYMYYSGGATSYGAAGVLLGALRTACPRQSRGQCA